MCLKSEDRPKKISGKDIYIDYIMLTCVLHDSSFFFLIFRQNSLFVNLTSSFRHFLQTIFSPLILPRQYQHIICQQGKECNFIIFITEFSDAVIDRKNNWSVVFRFIYNSTECLQEPAVMQWHLYIMEGWRQTTIYYLNPNSIRQKQMSRVSHDHE